MGIVLVAFLAARMVGVPPPATRTSTFKRTSSAARAGSRARFPSSKRYSMAMFFASSYPRSRRPCRNPSKTDEEPTERPEYK
jgi:hypothetical protein